MAGLCVRVSPFSSLRFLLSGKSLDLHPPGARLASHSLARHDAHYSKPGRGTREDFFNSTNFSRYTYVQLTELPIDIKSLLVLNSS